MLIDVSIGEAIDKLSILDIKSKKIKEEEKLKYVLEEKEYLDNLLNKLILKYIFYYDMLTRTNLKIWDLQDSLRLMTKDDSKYSSICEDIILMNDSRFLIKNKLNKLLNSKFQEQKGYPKRSVYLLCHLGLGDNITMVGCVRYLSLFYDEINVICKKRNHHNVKMLYMDDESIKTIPLVDDLSNETNQIRKYFEQNKCYENADVFISGPAHTGHFKSKITHPHFKDMKYIPNDDIKYWHIKRFFSDIKLNANIYHEYFYLPQLDESKELFNKISDREIVFCHTVSSNVTINVDVDLNVDNRIVVNPNINMYPVSHKEHELAETFLNLPLLYFLDIILNSNIIKVIDSSFCCIILPLSINNKLRCKNVEIISR